MKTRSNSRGFTLVEMIVAVGLFTIVMVVCVGALLALVGANRKVHALQAVMDNLNVTLDGMMRDVRMGSAYDGSGACTSNTGGPKDCTGGGTQFAYAPYGSLPTDPKTTYRLNAVTNRIERQRNGGPFQPVTSTSINIISLQIYVVGTNRGCAVNPCDTQQPKVVMDIKGTAPVLNATAKTSFHIQVTAVQRVLDL